MGASARLLLAEERGSDKIILGLLLCFPELLEFLASALFSWLTTVSLDTSRCAMTLSIICKSFIVPVRSFKLQRIKDAL